MISLNYLPFEEEKSVTSDIILLGHGSGGTLSHRLLDELIVPILSGIGPRDQNDAAVLAPVNGRLAFTTDSYVVDPLFFPGGDIGCLAVYGTVNDLAMAGARPLFISVGLILEEGLAVGRPEEGAGEPARRRRPLRREDRHRRHQGGAARQGRQAVHQYRRRRRVGA